MGQALVRWQFDHEVVFRDACDTLELSMLAVRAMCGTDGDPADLRYKVEHDSWSVLIDTKSDPGWCLERIFGGYAKIEFGDAAKRETCHEVWASPLPDIAARMRRN